jgi:hypothetical protein
VKERVCTVENVRVSPFSQCMKCVVVVILYTFKVCYVGNFVYCIKNGHRGVCNCNQCFVCFHQLLN